MDDALLLDPQVQDDVRQALVDDGVNSAEKFTEEAVVALATLGEHPTDMRETMLILLPASVRAQLLGAQLIAYHDEDSTPRWTVTLKGERAFDAAYAQLPPLSDREREALEQEYEDQLADAEHSLGLRSEPSSEER